MSLRSITSSLSVLVCFAGAAEAATITVSKGGAISTIQAGVTAASAGDTVLVKAGTYEEAVDVPAGKDGLTIKAKGKVIVDARAPNGDGLGPAIDVQSANVTIDGLEIRNADDDMAVIGDGIFFAGPGLTVSNCRFINCAGFAVRSLNGPGARVLGCDVLGCAAGIFIQGAGVQVSKTNLRMGDVGIKIFGSDAVIRDCDVRAISDQFVILEGDGARVERNAFVRAGGIGISIDGAAAVVSKNEIDQVGQSALFIDGAAPDVGKNEISRCGGNAIRALSAANGRFVKNAVACSGDVALQINGDGCQLTKNEVIDAIGGGIEVAGLNASLEKNTIRRCGGDAVKVEGTGLAIRKNDISDLSGDSEGIQVLNAGGGVIEDNTIESVGGAGVKVESSTAGIQIVGNRVRFAGDFFQDNGFDLNGSTHTIMDNVAEECAGDGFHVQGDSMTAAMNRSTGHFRDGFQFANGTNVTVDENLAKDNNGEGIEINANGTTVTNNKATGNRIDFADSSTGSTFTGNASSDGTHAAPAPPEVD